MKKGRSIITNFGCSFNCPYCIMKTNKIDNDLFVQNTDLQLNVLEDFLGESTKISVSGGGDPLYKYIDINSESRKFWDKLFKIRKIKYFDIDVHTRNILLHENFLEKINKYVLSVDKLTTNIIEFTITAQKYTKLRFSKVINDKTTIEEVEQFIEFCKNKQIELSLKQCVEHHTNDELFVFLKEKYKNNKNIFFIDYCDYNIYLMPNGTIKENFLKYE